MVKVTVLKCQKCGHEWIPRQKDVRQCPKCRTVRWDKPRERKEEK